MKKKVTICLTIIALTVSLLGFRSNPPFESSLMAGFEGFFSVHDFDPIVPSDADSSFMSYTDFRAELTPTTNENDIRTMMDGVKIRFDTAEELHRFSVDVSYFPDLIYQSDDPAQNFKLAPDIIGVLMDLDYVLGQTIDYSVVKSRTFIPIGYSFSSVDGTLNENFFTGSFDGRGFEIKNLYVAGFDRVVITEFEDEETVEIATSGYYAMFPYNQGVIKNLGLINPTLELRFEQDDLTRTANLVGVNAGLVDHVYVIDDRTSIFAAGIRMRPSVGLADTDYQAAGIVFDNLGTLSNAYYASRVVINGSFITNFEVQPVVFQNSGTVENLVYDSTLYQMSITIGATTFNVTPPNALAQPESTTTLRSNSTSGDWYYYPEDRYPSRRGLEFSNGRFQIATAIDLVTFSELLAFNTVLFGTPFREADYEIIADLDMSQVSPDAYQTPEVTFAGTLVGDDLESNRIIKNFTPEPVFGTEGYYTGLFSILTGTVERLTFSSAVITLQDTADFVLLDFYLGTLAGQLEGGVIRDVSVLTDMHAGNQAVGSLHMGAVVGMASGVVENVYATGIVDAGDSHTFAGSASVPAVHHIGGLIGAHGQDALTFYNGLSEVDLFGIGSIDTVNAQAGATVHLGGVIGRVEYSANVSHRLGQLSHEGALETRNLQTSSALAQYVGGVIALSTGTAPVLGNDTGGYTFSGLMDLTQRGNAQVYSAGIVVTEHTEPAEFVHLYNHGAFNTDTYTQIAHSALLYNRGSDLILSQAKNSANYTMPGNTDYPGIYFSEGNASTLLRFVENSGDITYTGVSIANERTIAGITRSTNVDFLNVIYSGNIAYLNISGTASVWMSGITRTLSPGRTMRNTLNLGSMTLAAVNTSQNTYVAGLVNVNQSGDLDPNGDDPLPRATQGILNSANYANITSHLNAGTTGFLGLGNTYVGGVVTFNNGSVQDSFNSGDLSIHNNSPINTSRVRFSTDATTGGRVIEYRFGVVIGGIAAGVFSQASRIYDTANNGEIIAMSRNFARAGGILGIALFQELTRGGVSVPGGDTILFSILSNGINYGNVSAITQNIHVYSTSTTSYNGRLYYLNTNNQRNFEGPTISRPTRTSTQERPGIYSSAGGVIGYGLSTMRRMINHGEISSTDVAGGVVGATYVGTTLQVNIDTAINYGSVRAFNNAFFNQIDRSMPYQDIVLYFYDVNDPFIFPNTLSDIRKFPESKRGIGGIFGRLQRGLNQRMQAFGTGVFDFIVNMDPNVDLIGRLDQVYNWTSTAGFYQFPNSLYYSARENDTTQAVFMGFEYYRNPVNQQWRVFGEGAEERYANYLRSWSWSSWSYTYSRDVQVRGSAVTENRIGGDLFRDIGNFNFSEGFSSTVTSSTPLNYSNWTTIDTETITQNQYDNPDTSVRDISGQEDFLSSSSASPNPYFLDVLPVPKVTEDPNDPSGDFIYDPNFIMRDDETLTANGEPITSYVYYIENALLAPRFQTERPFGMYVLSTSSGSDFGQAIPANISLPALYPLDGVQPFDIDYDDPPERVALEADQINGYNALRQTRFNDKSALLEIDQLITASESGGSDTHLLDADIDYDARIITFNLSLDTIAVGQNSISYALDTATLPAGAMIGSLNANQSDLVIDAPLDISVTSPPDLTLDLTPHFNITSPTNVLLGTFRSYSEAAVFDDLFTGNSVYFTDYEVRLNLIPRQDPQVSPFDHQLFVDGGGGVSFQNGLTVNEQLRFTFRDPAGVLPVGSENARFVVLEYAGHVVDPEDYTLLIEPLAGPNRQFGFTIVLDERHAGGEYTVRYRYYQADTEKTITFNKESSNDRSISSLSYPTSGEVIPDGTTFTSQIDFGFPLDVSLIDFDSIDDAQVPSYFDAESFSVTFLDHFELAPFARLTGVAYNGITYNDGYRTYQFTYTVESESGLTTVYTHNIVERPLAIVDAFTNNVRRNLNNLFATREAMSTTFSIDFDIARDLAPTLYSTDPANPDGFFAFTVSGVDFDGNPFNPAEIVGITATSDLFLNILIDDITEPGVYTFNFTYTRGGETVNVPENLVITKRQGVDAYLSDILFSETATETDYPAIAVSDAQGVPIDPPPFSPAIFFAGIDYDDSENIIFNYRIDGQVANTPLNEYTPFFLEFLPRGATIARQVFPIEDPSRDWTDEVDFDSSPALKAQLATDFTLMPETGQEPTEAEDVIITYRVTSEDGENEVFYHITVVDIVFNVSLIFEVVYDHPTLGLLDAANSELLGKTILINVLNFNTDVEVTNIIRPTVADFPEFEAFNDINTRANMFYTANTEDYRYRFGRNISGFFSFTVDLPQDDQGNDYAYEILFNNDPLNPIDDFVSGREGYYFYINGGTRNRTRRFTIVVSSLNTTVDTGWGLDDYFRSWAP